jgi:hypothetical protein
VIVLGIDPGAKGAGYAVWDSERDAGQELMHIGTEFPTYCAVDAIAVESGFIGKMGRQAMWGLGFDAGWRLCEAVVLATREFGSVLDDRIFTIRPDGALGWRAALPERPDLPAAARFAKFDGVPGDVIVNRLRLRYGLHAPTPPGEFPHAEHALGPGHTEHEVEACGIAEAAATILQLPKAKDRRALKAVKR